MLNYFRRLFSYRLVYLFICRFYIFYRVNIISRFKLSLLFKRPLVYFFFKRKCWQEFYRFLIIAIAAVILNDKLSKVCNICNIIFLYSLNYACKDIVIYLFSFKVSKLKILADLSIISCFIITLYLNWVILLRVYIFKKKLIRKKCYMIPRHRYRFIQFHI